MAISRSDAASPWAPVVSSDSRRFYVRAYVWAKARVGPLQGLAERGRYNSPALGPPLDGNTARP